MLALFFYWQASKGAESRLADHGLVRQTPVEFVVARLRAYTIMSETSEWERNMVERRPFKEHGDKPLADQPVRIETIVNAVDFPNDSQTHAWFFSSLDPPEVCLGTYHQHKISIPDLIFHPERPTFRRRA